MILVCITHAELAYRRYDGRMRTHAVTAAAPLDHVDLAILRQAPSELCTERCKSVYVKRHSPPPSPLITLGEEFQ